MNRLSALLILSFAIVMGFFAINGKQGVKELVRLKHEAALLESEKQRLQEEIVAQQQNIQRARTDSSFLEKKAREELGLARQGEVVYLLPKHGSS